KMNKDGTYRLQFGGSDGYVTRDPNGEIKYGVIERESSGGKPSSSPARFGSAEASVAGGFSMLNSADIYNESIGTWRGLNGTKYSIDPAPGKSRPFYGNGTTGGRSLAQNRAAAYGRLGTILGAYGVLTTEAEYRYNMSNNPGPNLKNYLVRKRIADQAMNGVGFIGLKGAMFSLGYNLGYGIEGLCNCNIQYNPYTRNFTPIEKTLTEYDNLGIKLE
ncbi:MAG: hypothetical protein MI974_11925, partial [Chitinophagales bacterium]|nr:hypothetical protein [Chitinophagales bacterium]